MNSLDISYIQNALETNIGIIKTIFVILCTYYTNYRITNTKLNSKIIHKFFYIMFISVICSLIRYGVNYLISIVCSIIMVGIMFSRHNIYKGILTTIISLSINYIISFFTVIISFFINVIIRLENNYINLIIIIIAHIILLCNFLKIKRLRYGISFLQTTRQNDYLDILILNISVSVLFLTVIMVNSNSAFVMDAMPGLIIFAIIMFITIQKSLQLYYKQKLLVKELNEAKEEIEKKSKEIGELEAENLSFSKKSHTLAHKQKALEYKLEQIINKTEISKEEAGEVRDRLKEIEKDLYKEKSEIELDKTGIEQIDDMLKYMQSECKKNKIDFELQLKGNIHYMTNNLIPKEDLETLLADHIKNAIIAINHTNNINRSILVRLGKIEGIYSLYVYDSGIEFEPQTLENLGKQPSTTHADEGGTGMGFMNTFDTLNKSKASLIIEEYNKPSKDNYTKVIIIKFDNKNEFQIKSYREKNENQLELSTKSDIIVDNQEGSEGKEMDISINVEDYKLNVRAAGIIIHNNKILTHRNVNADHYALIGGRVEIGETSEETIKREIMEEIGKEIEITGYISTIENFFELKNEKYHEIMFIHKIEFVNEEDKKIEETINNIEGKEYLKYKWLDLDKIDEYPLKPEIIKDILKNGNIPIHKINNDLK